MSSYRKLIMIVVSLVLGLGSNAWTLQKTSIPDGVKLVLDHLHPGWKLAEISDEDRQICFKNESKYEPTLIWGDFDGDGKQDYAAIIKYGTKTAVIAFLARGTGYQPFEVFVTSQRIKRPPDLLHVFPKGAQLGGTHRKALHESITAEYCESSTIVYFYEAGTFHQVITED